MSSSRVLRTNEISAGNDFFKTNIKHYECLAPVLMPRPMRSIGKVRPKLGWPDSHRGWQGVKYKKYLEILCDNAKKTLIRNSWWMDNPPLPTVPFLICVCRRIHTPSMLLPACVLFLRYFIVNLLFS